MKWTGLFDVQHLTQPNYDGVRTVLWEGTVYNNLADEGERNVLDSYLRNINHPSSFYIRLANDTPVDTDSLASITGEPGFNVGYAQQQVLRSSNANGWPTLTFVGGNAQASSKQVTFDFTGSTTVTYAFLATSSDNNGLHIAYASLGSSKSLISGEQLRLTFKPTLS